MTHNLEAHDFEDLLRNGKINPYFYKQLTGVAWQLLDDADKLSYLESAVEMSRLGVSNKEEARHYYILTTYAPEILQNMLKKHIGEPLRNKLVSYMYENKLPIGDQIDLYDSVVIAASKIGIPVDREILRGIEFKRTIQPDRFQRKAYPQSWGGGATGQVYDVSRWMKAMRDIYAKASATGEGLDQAFDEATKNWGKMEQIDFKYWMRFYQEGAHNKYKIARHIPTSEGGYYVPGDLRAELPMPFRDEQFAVDTPKEPDINDARLSVEKQRSRIISRLNSAEKLLASLEGQLFAGDDQEYMLKLLQDLKLKVQIANKIRVRSSLFEDFIYRTANLLNHNGKKKAAAFFYKIADAPPDPSADILAGLPGEAPQGAPPDMAGLPTDSGPKADTQAALREYFKLLQTGVADLSEKDEIKNSAQDDFDSDIVVYAQEAPAIEAELPAAPTELPAAPMAETLPAAPEQPIAEPGTLPIEPSVPSEKAEKVDDAIENALKNITVNDVVRRLDLLSGLFKKREIARQLAIIDMMMDRLGIGTFFPSLGEATRSALESNQYVATRLEDVLSRLRGALDSEKSEQFIQEQLTTPSQPSPGTEGVRHNLKQQEDEEASRKERRREREEQRMEKPTMEESAPQELQAPTRVEQARPIETR